MGFDAWTLRFYQTMPKILLIEDEQDIAWVYKTVLKDQGFEVIHCSDGVSGEKTAAQLRPDCIVLDLVLPKKNGYDVLADLKANEATKNIPVIILSNLGQDYEIKKAFELGAEDFLVKVNTLPRDIINKIKTLLKL